MHKNLKHCIPFYSSVTLDATAFLLFCSSTKYKRKIITHFLKLALSIRWVKFTKEIKAPHLLTQLAPLLKLFVSPPHCSVPPPLRCFRQSPTPPPPHPHTNPTYPNPTNQPSLV